MEPTEAEEADYRVRNDCGRVTTKDSSVLFVLFPPTSPPAVLGYINAVLPIDVPSVCIHRFVFYLFPVTDSAADSGSPGSRGASEMSRTPAKVSETNAGFYFAICMSCEPMFQSVFQNLIHSACYVCRLSGILA